MTSTPIWKRKVLQILAGTFALLIMNCAGKGTEPEEQEISSSRVSSSNHAISFTMNSSNTINSSSEQKSFSVSSSQLTSSSSDLNPVTAGSSPIISSSLQKYSSSSPNPISSSSSQVAQPLQFQGNQVRIPDGCSTIQWASGPAITCVSDFWVDTTEVTIGAYQALMGGGIPSLYHNGIFFWPKPSGTGVADDGTLCPNCPADKLTIYEAMLYANAMTKSLLQSSDTVYRYTAIDSADAPGYYLKVKVKEVVGLQGLVIDSTKLGFRLPTQGEFKYMCLKTNLLELPWEDLYPDSSQVWLFGDGYDLFVWSNQNSDQVTHPVASKLGTSWHLYDLLGNADEWTTTPNSNYPGEFMALGGSAELNGFIHWDLRMDGFRAGVRLVRGKRI